MIDATLRLLYALRGAACPDRTPPPEAMSAFMLVLYGPSASLLEHHRASEVGGLLAAVDPSAGRAHPFRLAYLVAGDDPGVPAPHLPGTGALAIERLFALPRAPRAALALSCVLGFRDEEVGIVLGVGGEEARAVVEGAVEAIRATSAPMRPPAREQAA